jgi:hypothetical protein
MFRRRESPIEVAAEAVRSAEEGLVELSLSPEVRDLQRRVSAVKTVLMGIVRVLPRLTSAQRERLAKDAVALADRVWEIHTVHGPSAREPSEAE